MRKRRFPLQNKSLKEVATQRRRPKNYRKAWTAEEINLVKTCDYFGISDQVIAKDLKRTVAAIHDKRTKLGLQKEIREQPIKKNSRAPQSHFGIMFKNCLSTESIKDISLRLGLPPSHLQGACSKQSKMTLSKKRIYFIGDEMGLSTETILQLIAAHELDKKELGRKWMK